MIDLLILPAIACLALVGIHVYFGAFVLRRGILFIDLALAQWAALGYIFGVLLHVHDPILLFGMGFGATAVAALFLTALKKLYKTINLQEAVIGVIYIGGSALATGLLATFGVEGHHFKEMLSGDLLFIQPAELFASTAIYIVIAGILLKFHQSFLSAKGTVWDFIFYLLFGFVVTSSVKLVGILLVFSYLVLPILSTTLFSSELRTQVLWGWVIGIIGSFSGLASAVYFDMPPSLAIIQCLCVIWLILCIVAWNKA